MAARPLSLLEQWLEGLPHSTADESGSVKREKRESCASHSFDPSRLVAVSRDNRFLPPATLQPQPLPPPPLPPVRLARLVSVSCGKPHSLSLQTVERKPEVKCESRAIDEKSEEGVFGWACVGGLFVPVIYRGVEGLVPVRIVESKIIAQFSNSLTWSVFSCINIRSYYVTEKEAILLNEINTQHCDCYYGFEAFSPKDVVVCLTDVHTLHSFLETSREIFAVGLNKSSVDWLGFVNISGSIIAPFITKTTSGVSRRLVPESLVARKVLLDRLPSVQMDEWDASYVRMLLIYAGLDHVNLPSDDRLYCLEDLKWDSSFCPLHIEECSPPLASSFRSVAKTFPSSQEPLDDAWMRSSSASSPNTTLRSLHQVSTVEVAGVRLKAINLKPYTSQQAVFVGDLVARMFRGVPHLTVLHVLGQILQVKLYEYTR